MTVRVRGPVHVGADFVAIMSVHVGTEVAFLFVHVHVLPVLCGNFIVVWGGTGTVSRSVMQESVILRVRIVVEAVDLNRAVAQLIVRLVQMKLLFTSLRKGGV